MTATRPSAPGTQNSAYGTLRPLDLPFPPVSRLPSGPGDRVGVAALSGPVDPERLARGLEALRRLGFEPVPRRQPGSPRTASSPASDEERLAAFHELAADPDLARSSSPAAATACCASSRASTGTCSPRRPRAYVGYSDLTPFLLEVVRRLGLVAFHGPMVAGGPGAGPRPAEEEASLLGALGRPLSGRAAVRCRAAAAGGAAEGPLLGGCLSLLAATLGTPSLPDLEARILFWEDVNEPPLPHRPHVDPPPAVG